MALIASVNYTSRRIFLGIDSVGLAAIDPINIYKDYRGRRASNIDNGQNFFPLITPRGNQSIGGGERTPEFTNLATGVRIVPYDANQIIKITGFLISQEDELQGNALFDRSGLVSSIDIDYLPPATKIVEVNTGSGLTSEQATQISTIFNDVSALARGDISVNDFDKTLTIRRPDGTVVAVFDLSDKDGVPAIVGAVQRTAQ